MDTEIEEAKELIKNSQYVHKSDFETKVLFFDSFCKFDWKYVSGDDKALSVISGTNKSYRTISTNVYRLLGWSASTVEIWEGSAFGRNGSVADEKYNIIDTKKNIMSDGNYGYEANYEYNEETGVFTVTETTTDNATVTIVLKPDGTLQLTVKGENSAERSCTYKKAASYR